MTASVQRDAFCPVSRGTRPLPRPLRVALVNNMPDAALVATERQFRSPDHRSSDPDRPVSCQVYLPARGSARRSRSPHCRSHYRPVADLLHGAVDLLVVTGCEPRAGSLTGEPFWDSFTGLVEWAKTNTRSALWSCLAAHAAVLHLDGIERHRFAAQAVRRIHVFDRGGSPAADRHQWSDAAGAALASQRPSRKGSP